MQSNTCKQILGWEALSGLSNRKLVVAIDDHCCDSQGDYESNSDDDTYKSHDYSFLGRDSTVPKRDCLLFRRYFVDEYDENADN